MDERYYTQRLWEEACSPSLFYCVGYMSSLSSSQLMCEATTRGASPDQVLMPVHPDISFNSYFFLLVSPHTLTLALILGYRLPLVNIMFGAETNIFSPVNYYCSGPRACHVVE